MNRSVKKSRFKTSYLKNLLDFLLFNIKVTRMNDMFLKIDLVLLRKKSESILEK